MIDTDEKLQAIVQEFVEHGSIWATDENGIIKKGAMLMHLSKDKSPLFENEKACQAAALYATMVLRKMGYAGEAIYSKTFNGFGVRVGDKL
jgi:hypothetical protein